MTRVYAEIILEGLKTFSDVRRYSFEKKYHNVLEELRAAVNEGYPGYTDARVGLAKQELRDFEEAYLMEFKLQNKEAKGDE